MSLETESETVYAYDLLLNEIRPTGNAGRCPLKLKVKLYTLMIYFYSLQ